MRYRLVVSLTEKDGELTRKDVKRCVTEFSDIETPKKLLDFSYKVFEWVKAGHSLDKILEDLETTLEVQKVDSDIKEGIIENFN